MGYSCERFGISWIDIQCTLKFVDCQIMVSRLFMNACKRDVGRWNSIIKLRGLSAVHLSLFKPSRIRVDHVLQPISLPEAGKSKCEARVGLHRVLEQRNS